VKDVRFDFSGKVVVVTGAANGIGAACARLFAQSGAALALWDLDGAAARALATELGGRSAQGSGASASAAGASMGAADASTSTAGASTNSAGAPAIAIDCDVARSTDVARALAETTARFGRVDILINNAGIFRAADFLDIAEADWDAVLAVNLKGAFLVGQAVARAMASSGGGAIVNMSSVNGVTAIPNIASYNASKGGIDQLTRAMALALAEHGIRVNAVAPGTIATELARRAVLGSREAEARILSRTPLARLGEPAEVAAVCAFLASDAASYMTGEIVYVDGGRLALNYTMPPRAAPG
jgi:3-oxoacyl-[acyl-carrier protein] reductase